MRKNLLYLLLGASLLLNAMAIGGFLYVRHYAMYRLNVEAVSQRLDLDAAGRAQLVAFRRQAWNAILDSRHDNQEAAREINSVLAEKPAGDPAFSAALAHLNAARQQRQEKLLPLILGFRDGLTPASRERFTAMSHDPGFVLELMGLRLDNAGP